MRHRVPSGATYSFMAMRRGEGSWVGRERGARTATAGRASGGWPSRHQLAQRLTPGHAGVDLVPVLHGRLAQPPAQVDGTPIRLGGEVHQAVVVALELQPELLQLAHEALDVDGQLLRLALQALRVR